MSDPEQPTIIDSAALDALHAEFDQIAENNHAAWKPIIKRPSVTCTTATMTPVSSLA
jgi:hypothetical protein